MFYCFNVEILFVKKKVFKQGDYWSGKFEIQEMAGNFLFLEMSGNIFFGLVNIIQNIKNNAKKW